MLKSNFELKNKDSNRNKNILWLRKKKKERKSQASHHTSNVLQTFQYPSTLLEDFTKQTAVKTLTLKMM